jgi:hypothetical protein
LSEAIGNSGTKVFECDSFVFKTESFFGEPSVVGGGFKF